jgi:tRNA(Ile)-lysidine synthase
MSVLTNVRTTILDYHLFSRGERVVVAVSGGADSVALLHMLVELAPELAIHLHIAHLNHRLRGEASKEDAEFVAEMAGELALPRTIEERDVAGYARAHHLSLEEAARIVRYNFLSEVAAEVDAHTIATGHNADDQVETIIMHLLRGAGLAGLRGMTYKSTIPSDDSPPGGVKASMRLVRPLLDVARDDVEAYCLEKGLTPRFDKSNLDTTFFRNRIRREVIPFLEQLNPNLREILRHSALTLADDYDYLRAASESAFSQVALHERGEADSGELRSLVFDREKWRELPVSLQRATLREGVRRLRRGMRDISWVHIEDARRVALDKGAGSEATLPQGLALIVGYDELILGETVTLPDIPLLHVEVLELRIGSTLALPGSEWQVWMDEAEEFNLTKEQTESSKSDEQRWFALFDADQVGERVILRTRRPGERFEPTGLGGRHKSLHEFMIDEKIPRHVRDLLPILADDERILWVCGYKADERSKLTDHTKRYLSVRFRKSIDKC